MEVHGGECGGSDRHCGGFRRQQGDGAHGGAGRGSRSRNLRPEGAGAERQMGAGGGEQALPKGDARRPCRRRVGAASGRRTETYRRRFYSAEVRRDRGKKLFRLGEWFATGGSGSR